MNTTRKTVISAKLFPMALNPNKEGSTISDCIKPIAFIGSGERVFVNKKAKIEAIIFNQHPFGEKEKEDGTFEYSINQPHPTDYGHEDHCTMVQKELNGSRYLMVWTRC